MPTLNAPKDRYPEQRRGAIRRGVEWHFTFESWWDVWQKSGKWEQRGCRLGQYVMARSGDCGPYSVENVRIITCSENNREAHTNGCSPPPPIRPKVGRKPRIYVYKYKPRPGARVARGWRFRPHKSRKRPYEVRYRCRFVGQYATEQEARDAYLAAVSAAPRRIAA